MLVRLALPNATSEWWRRPILMRHAIHLCLGQVLVRLARRRAAAARRRARAVRPRALRPAMAVTSRC